MDGKESSRSWFCVLNNPADCYEGEPQDIAEKALDDWISEKPTRTGAIAYCISAEGLHHLHMVLEDSNKSRFSNVKKIYHKAHIEPTKGTKEQAEAYINKHGKWEEKGEKIVYIARFGEIKGCQGQRKDMEIIEDYIQQGYTPRQIMDMSFSYRRYDKMIKSAYFDKRYKETPFVRDVTVYWHIGESGTGKSYTANKLIEEKGEEHVYMVTDYDCNGCGSFDLYNGEEILFLDEFRGQLTFQKLLNILDKYKNQIHSRYSNVYALWNEVHVTSVLPPELIYKRMVEENRDVDTIKQLMRRVNYMIYHYKDKNEYKTVQIVSSEYVSYEVLKSKVHADKDGFMKVSKEELEELRFD